MKNIFTAILFLSVAFGFGQENTSPKEDAKLIKEKTTDGKSESVNIEFTQIFTSVDVQAQPSEGMQAFRKYIASSFKLPEVSEKTIARVVAKFVVSDDGSVKYVQILEETPSNLGLGKETIRVLTNSRKWVSAIMNGKAVNQYYTLPISFEIPATRKKGQPIEELKNEKLQLPDAIGNFKTPKDSLEIQPEPIEGFKTFYYNVQNNIHIPENVLNGKYRTKVSFIVDTDGALLDFKIVEETPKSIGLGEEVIRVLKTFPKWKPGTKKTFYMLPVTTVVENEPEPKTKKD